MRRNTPPLWGAGRRTALLAAVLAMTVAFALPAGAQGDAGPWPQLHGDGDNTRQGVAAGPGDPGVKWFTTEEDLVTDSAPEGLELVSPYQPTLAPDGTLLVGARALEMTVGEGNTQLVAIDADDGEALWSLPYVHTSCVPTIDSQGRVWALRHSSDPEVSESTLQAIDAEAGEWIPGTGVEDVPRCAGTPLHAGGADDHVAWMDGGGGARADTLAVYDVSGAQAEERWILEADGDPFDQLVGNELFPAIAFTDAGIIVPARSDDFATTELVEFDLTAAVPDVASRVELPLIPEDPAEPPDGSDIGHVYLLKDGETLIAGVRSPLGGGDAEAYVAAFDTVGGLAAATWTEVLEGGDPNDLALGDGVVVTKPSSRAHLVALDVADGEEAWRVDTRSDELVTDSGGAVYTTTQHESSGAVSSYSASGELRWEAPVLGIDKVLGLEGGDTLTNEPEYGPIDAEGTLYVVDSGRILAIDDSGGLVAEPPDEDDDDEDRIAGPDRIATSVELCQSYNEADTVVLARSDDYPDALAGAPLATALEACILLTPSSGLHDAVAAEIARLGADEAVLLGGTGALSSQVENDLAAIGVTDTTRHAGANRFETAAMIAAELPEPSGNAFVVEGQNPDPNRGWPDAVAVSALAAYTQSPILLVTSDNLPPATHDALADPSVVRATIVGGTAVVSAEVEQLVTDTIMDSDAPDRGVDREAGLDRYDTSARLADLAMTFGMEPSTVWAATGGNWPDSLSAAPIVGSQAPAVATDGGVMLLVNGGDLDNSSASRDWLEDNAAFIDNVRVVGGPNAVSNTVLAQMRAAAQVQ